MPNLIIRGAKPMSITLRGRKNGFMTTVAFTADLSKPLIKAMGWEEHLLESTNWEKVSLTSSVGAGAGVLVPNGSEIEQAFKFDSIIGFVATQNETDSDKKPEMSLSFKVRMSGKGSAGMFEKFWQKNKDIDCQLKVEYSEQAPIEPSEEEAEGEVEE